MVANLIRKYSKIALDAEALEQYKIMDDGLQKLANLTKQGWHMCTSDLYDLEMHATLVEGMIIGAGVTGLVVYICKKRKERCKKDS